MMKNLGTAWVLLWNTPAAESTSLSPSATSTLRAVPMAATAPPNASWLGTESLVPEARQASGPRTQ